MPSSIDNLLRLNVLDSDDISDVKHYTLYTTRPDLVLKNGNIKEKVPAIIPYENIHRHSWEHEDFNYKFSNLGFRDGDMPSHVNLAAFGCSYTFGVGLPEDKIWHKVLAKKQNCKTYNFGQPGASIKAIVDIFSIVCNHVKIDKAVVLLPAYHRVLIASQHLSEKNIALVGLMPNNMRKTWEADYDIDIDMYYKYIPAVELINKMKEDIYMMEYIARHKKIELYISSWDAPTYELLKSLKTKHMKLINQWTDPEGVKDDFARDRMHPGMLHHVYWADKIQEQVF
jgi:hypothetical protein